MHPTLPRVFKLMTALLEHEFRLLLYVRTYLCGICNVQQCTVHIHTYPPKLYLPILGKEKAIINNFGVFFFCLFLQRDVLQAVMKCTDIAINPESACEYIFFFIQFSHVFFLSCSVQIRWRVKRRFTGSLTFHFTVHLFSPYYVSVVNGRVHFSSKQ